MAETSDKKGLLATAKERFATALEAWEPNRTAFLEDIKFLRIPGAQWDAKDRKQREDQRRPCLEVDKLGQYVRQVVNDGRQNRPAVKVRPVDSNGDPKVAEALQGLIRHICDRSKADQAFDTALEHAVIGGFGFFLLTTEAAHEKAMEQEIRIQRVSDPLTVLLDPLIQEADGSDASYGFVVSDVPKDVFKKKWPKAKFTNWEADGERYGDGWLKEKTVRVCSYYYKVESPTTIHRLDDGTTVTDKDYQAAIAKGVVVAPITLDESGQPLTRVNPSFSVKWCRMTGAEILEENDWSGKFIPIIPVFGNETDIEGKVTYSGLIRNAKDAMRLYNYSRSAYAERVALTPKAPYVAAEGQIEGYEEEWKTANSENHSVLTYKPIDNSGNPVPPPQRQLASDIPEGFARDMQLSEHDIQAALGMYSASLGQQSNEKSGKAIMARQREGDTATFHYQDNQSRAIGYLGVQLVDLIPKIYDSKRSIRILGEDGAVTTAMLDPSLGGAMEKQGNTTIYNLGVGRYDVSVAAGPSYTTKRMEAAEAMMQLTQANPALFQMIGDLMVRNMDWPGADEIADRLKKMLPPQLQDENEDESPEVQAVKAQAQQVIDQQGQQLEEAQAQLQAASEELKRLKDGHDLKAAEVSVKGYEAETARITALAPVVDPQLIQQIVLQTIQTLTTSSDVDPGNGGADQQMPMQPMQHMMPDGSMMNGPPMEMMGEMMPDQQPPEGGFFTPDEGMS